MTCAFLTAGYGDGLSKYVVDYYKCGDCGVSFVSDDRRLERNRYGANFLAYVIYNIIEVHIPQYKLAHVIQKTFGYPLGQPTINRMIQRAAEKYRSTYEEISQRLSHGKLIHADETHVSVKGKVSYVWVFTSMDDVIYIWSETREGSVATEFLKEFAGVLVSELLLCLRFGRVPTAEMPNSSHARLEQ